MKPKSYDLHRLHHEVTLEQHLVEQLVVQCGYIERSTDCYDQSLAIDASLVTSFLEKSQPHEIAKMREYYGASSKNELHKQLSKALKQRGTLEVLRHGLKLIPGIHFRLCFFAPASTINQDLVRLYDSNVLSVMRQVRYSVKNDNILDVVLFVNGLPVATMEIKNVLTGSSVRHAERQYRTDRSPAGEPLLTFKRGALVHFALDEDNVTMTTQLQNSHTRFCHLIVVATEVQETRT